MAAFGDPGVTNRGAPGRAAFDAHADFEQFRTRMFDPASYLAQNGDVAAQARAHPEFDTRRHFVTTGQHEGRAPSFLFQPHHAARWFAMHERRAVPARDALAEFHARPASRRFVPNRWFNAAAFRALYAAKFPETAGWTDYRVFEFYVDRCGAQALSPSGLFSEEAYRAAYPDVAAAVRDGAFLSGLHHFVTYGPAEGRVNLPGYGRRADAEAPPARQTEASLLLDGPAGLGLDLWWFDEAFYLSLYPDAHAAKRAGRVMCGLEHFMLSGFAEGRTPQPAFAPAAPGANPWEHFGALDKAASAKPDTRIGFGAARALRDRLAAEGVDRGAATRAIWPFARRPDIRARFDAERYLALNPDVARAVADGSAGSAESHWRHDGLREQRLAPGTNIFPGRRLGLRDFLGWKRGVNVFAPISSVSGLGQASRRYLAALRAAEAPAEVHDVSGLIRPDLPLDLIDPDRLAYSINLFMLNPEQVMAFVDRYGAAVFDHRANVGFWVWELAAPRPEWKTVLSGFDLLIAPSEFCRAAFASFTDLPVRTVPYAVDPAGLRALAARADPANPWLVRLRAEKAAGRRIVLFVMDASSYTARKGVDVFLAMAERARATMPGRCLFCVKTHSADVSGFDGLAADAPVLLIDAVLGEADLCALKTLADVYVSPHRSEGFGLNILESLLLGVPTLCSPHGGGVDLLPPDYPHFIGGALREVGRDMGPYRRGAVWFEPDPTSAMAQLVRILDDGPDPRAAMIAGRLATRLSAAAVGAGLRAALEAHCGFGEPRGPALAGFRTLSAEHAEELFDVNFGPGDADRVLDQVGACLAPRLTVVTAVSDEAPEDLAGTYADLLGQTFPSWEWCLACPEGREDAAEAIRRIRRRDARVKVAFAAAPRAPEAALNAAASLGVGEALVLVRPGARLDPALLRAYADHLTRHERAAALYCDDADETPGAPSLRPDWSPELALSAAYVRDGLCVRKVRFLELGGLASGAGDAAAHDLLLRASRNTLAGSGAQIVHVDRPLVRSRPPAPGADAAVAAALARHAKRLGLDAAIEPGLLPGTHRMRPRIRAGRVAISILTAGTVNPLTGYTYIGTLVRSMLAHAIRQPCDIRVVADAPAAAGLMGLEALDARVRVVAFDRGAAPFNFSDKANFAVRGCDTDRLVLMNDDMETLDGEWLGALLEMLEVPGVGVVGGRLLYADGTIQHCGIGLGVCGAAAHVFGGLPAGAAGYGGYTHVIRNWSAVTGALMAFRRSTFEAAGGFDPAFPVDYNDVDFCLRTLKAGLRVVCTPYAALRHFESASAPRLAADALDERRFRERWGPWIARDPYFNANFRRDTPLCEPLPRAAVGL